MPTADTIATDTLALPFYLQHEAYHVDTAREVNTGIPLDSIFRPYDAPDTVYRQTMFIGHKLVPSHQALQERPDMAAPGWLFVAIVMLCAALCFYYRIHKLKIRELTKSFFDSHAASRTMRSSLQGAALLPIALILCASISLAIWHMALQYTNPLICLLIALGLTVGYLLRNALLSALATVFDSREAMSTYINGNYIYHLLLATVITPMLFILVYLPGAAQTTAVVMGGLAALTFILRFLRGSKLFLTISKGFNLFLFYYLCTVELIPLLVALKWIISQYINKLS